MSFFELLLLALALSMDAFAVSVCKGFSVKRMNMPKAVVVGLYFGIFQALMPLIGYLFANTFSERIEGIAHFAAFLLLMGIGIKMIYEAVKEDKSCPTDSGSLRFFVMIPLAVATSLDALAAGISFSLLQVDIIRAVLLIGSVTFFICLLGVKAGHYLGMKHQMKAEIAGGIILIILGLKIIAEHFEMW